MRAPLTRAPANAPARKSRAVGAREGMRAPARPNLRGDHSAHFAPFSWLEGLTRADAPSCEAELLDRARRLAGHTVGDLATHLGSALPAQQLRAKGLIGALIERALGADPSAGSAPDFPALGIELKTLPIDRRQRPRESTFVCTAQLRELAEGDWERSGVRRKLTRVLWVPIEADPQLPLGVRRIGSARLWQPSPEQEAQLRADWEELAGLVGRGELEQITAHVGRYLQLRPKARDSRVLGRGFDERGAPLRTPPRGFYLRPAFTAAAILI